MNIESLQQYCLSKKGVTESLPFGPDNLVFKVGGKLFLLASLDTIPLRFNVKCDPDEAEQRVLWNVECLLQKILVEPFDKNYDALIKQAKARLMQG